MNALGFGFLRLPMIGEEIDFAEVIQMVDRYIAGGGTFFDTAYTYLNGKSEEGLRKAVVERYPRACFQISSKMPGYMVKSYEDCERFFETSRKRCGVEYFDIFMLHWLNRKHYALAEKFDEFRFLRELKASGRAKRIGFSFHDTAELLDEILTRHPEVDCVLLQLNYLDWESSGIQSRKCYETALRHGKTVMAMEPIKGGTLVNVPENVRRILDKIDPTFSPAGHALRFARNLPGVEIVLSGMGSLAQVEENLRPVTPMTQEEYACLAEAADALKSTIAVPCTGCGYCVKHCPEKIAIPQYFSLYNESVRNPRDRWKMTPVYGGIAATRGKASACIGCGRCEQNCPQKISIREMLKKVAAELE